MEPSYCLYIIMTIMTLTNSSEIRQLDGTIPIGTERTSDQGSSLKYNVNPSKDHENTLKDSQKALKDSQNSLKVNQNSPEDNQNQLKDNQNSLKDHDYQFKDSQTPLKDSQHRLKDHERSFEESIKERRGETHKQRTRKQTTISKVTQAHVLSYKTFRIGKVNPSDSKTDSISSGGRFKSGIFSNTSKELRQVENAQDAARRFGLTLHTTAATSSRVYVAKEANQISLMTTTISIPYKGNGITKYTAPFQDASNRMKREWNTTTATSTHQGNTGVTKEKDTVNVQKVIKQLQPILLTSVTTYIRQKGNGIAKDTIKVQNVTKQPALLTTMLTSTHQRYKDKANNMSKDICVMNVSRESVNTFRHLVDKLQKNFIYLKLIPDRNISIKGTFKVVAQTTWVWTFYGKDGALEFLSFPPEFKTWSLGLLYTYSTGPIDIKLTYVSGNCKNVVVGQRHSDMAISKALSTLTLTLMNMIYPENEYKYGPSFWCYMQRAFINPHQLYTLCHYIVCPIPAVRYKCCNFVFNAKNRNRSVMCEDKTHGYDNLWWAFPIVVATVLFMYCPLLIMLISAKCSFSHSKRPVSRREAHYRNLNADEPWQDIIFLNDTYPVTLLGTLMSPLICKSTRYCSRIARIFIPFSSLTFIGIQILLDYTFLHDIVIESIDKGVPHGFRSIIAGYHASSGNFMHKLGGPYVALSIYICLTCMFMAIPKSLSCLLQSGLPKDIGECNPTSPVTLDLQTIEGLGSVSVLQEKGYLKIYRAYISQFYTLLNVKFWKYAFSLQHGRLKGWFNRYYCGILVPLIPFYIVVCFFELVLCLIVYGLPIVSFACTITRAYCGAVLSVDRPNCFLRTVQWLLNILLIVCVMYFLFMFCTIFLDACLFVTRVCMFTYTGIIVYPKTSYGYLIFSFTVLYYMTVCSKTFAEKYRKLLKTTISACDKTQRANDYPRLVVNSNDFRGIKKQLFEHIIEMHCPKRKQVFIFFLKLFTILLVLGVSLNLLTKTDRFRELHTLVHVGTALFTCALPTIFIKACRGPDDRIKDRLFRRRVAHTVRNYAGYLQDFESDDSE